MKLLKEWKNTQFIRSCTLPEHYPRLLNDKGTSLPEVALAGRSNVGKSSLLNDLCGNQSLAKISSTPGKTQLINFFVVDETFALVDLPGYGYAKVPPQVKKQWGPMIQAYLEKREALALILFLLDIRRIPNQEDIQFLEWATWHKKPILLAFTKVDKLSKPAVEQHTKQALQALPFDNLHYIHYSAKTHQGKYDLVKAISSHLLP